jgi:signal transduction histidine kinase
MPPSVHQAVPDADPPSRRPARAAGALRNLTMDENRRSFLRMVSHELRTPLNSIIGFSEIIASELYGPINEPRYRDHAKLVHESGHRLLKLVNDVLDIARLEAGAMDLDLRPENPLIAIEETLRHLGDEARERAVRLVVCASAETPAVLADSRGLRTIFANLIQNAVAHSPTGGVVEIGARREGEEVVFEIADHGQGVSEDDLARILKPFEQAENALVRRSEGAGLGLAIVGLLCQAMDGRLTVRSSPGQGLTAVVRLPVAEPLRAV